MLNMLKAILYGIVEGITEWLPISSTGHMILLEEWVKLDVTPQFWEMFLVVIQLGAVMAVVLLFWSKIWPFAKKKRGGIRIKADIMLMWIKILVACIPAIIVGLLFDDWCDAHFYNSFCVALALIIFGLFFILIELWNDGKKPKVRRLADISFLHAAIIGCFQVLAAVFPGTSRSGATIVGALLLGISRTVAAEFTFFMAIPVMAGASLLKLIKFKMAFAPGELYLLVFGMLVAFIVSVFVIRFLMGYIKKNDFKMIGLYRIYLGIFVLVYFAIQSV